MKTLIAYATNHGATKRYAEALAARLAGDTVLIDLKQQSTPDLRAFDAVVVGTAIYYGQPQKAAKDFCARNLEQLRTKRLGLFICSLIAEQAEAALKTAFPAELQESVVAKGMFGGEMIMNKLGFGERLIARAVTKGNKDLSKFSEEPLAAFASALASDRT